jgi:hypothetical protein
VEGDVSVSWCPSVEYRVSEVGIMQVSRSKVWRHEDTENGFVAIKLGILLSLPIFIQLFIGSSSKQMAWGERNSKRKAGSVHDLTKKRSCARWHTSICVRAQTDRQTDRQTERQKDRQTDRQTDSMALQAVLLHALTQS